MVMGKGEGICDVMNQLAHGVKVQQMEMLPIFQPGGNTPYVRPGAFPVMAVEPLVGQRAFQIGGGVFVRLGAAEQKGQFVSPGYFCEIMRHQIFS